MRPFYPLCYSSCFLTTVTFTETLETPLINGFKQKDLSVHVHTVLSKNSIMCKNLVVSSVQVDTFSTCFCLPEWIAEMCHNVLLRFIRTVERHGQGPLVSAGGGEGEDGEELQHKTIVRLVQRRAFNITGKTIRVHILHGILQEVFLFSVGLSNPSEKHQMMKSRFSPQVAVCLFVVVE